MTSSFIRNLNVSFRHPYIISLLLVNFCVMSGLAGFWLIIAEPEYDKHQSAALETAKLREKIKSKIQTIELSKSYLNNIKNIEAIEEKLAAEGGQAVFVNSLMVLAKSNNIKVLDSSYKDEDESRGFIRQNQEVMLEGTYIDIKHFIYDVQMLPTLTIIHETRLEPIKGLSQLKASLTLKTYRKVEI